MSKKKKALDLPRAISYAQLIGKRRTILEFEGDMLASFGKPELTGSWLIYGIGKNGKTSAALKICKYMTRFGRVAYDSLEEGDSQSFADASVRAGMGEVKNKFMLLSKEPIDVLKKRLRKHKAPKIVVIDSVKYSKMTTAQYKELIDEFAGKVLFIIIAHADGKNPRGNVATDIYYDAFVTMRVEGFTGHVTSRYGGGEPFIIDKEMAGKYEIGFNK